MKHEKIDDKARVWMIVRREDGRLQEQLDPRFLATLEPALAAELTEAAANAAGRVEVAGTRAW